MQSKQAIKEIFEQSTPVKIEFNRLNAEGMKLLKELVNTEIRGNDLKEVLRISNEKLEELTKYYS